MKPEPIVLLEQTGHVPHGESRRVVEAFVEGHGHESVAARGKRQIDVQIPPNRKSEPPLQARFDGRLVHLAVPLRRVPIPTLNKAPSIHMGRKRRIPASSSLLSMLPPNLLGGRLSRRPPVARRCNTDLAEEGTCL